MYFAGVMLNKSGLPTIVNDFDSYRVPHLTNQLLPSSDFNSHEVLHNIKLS